MERLMTQSERSGTLRPVLLLLAVFALLTLASGCRGNYFGHNSMERLTSQMQSYAQRQSREPPALHRDVADFIEEERSGAGDALPQVKAYLNRQGQDVPRLMRDIDEDVAAQ